MDAAAPEGPDPIDPAAVGPDPIDPAAVGPDPIEAAGPPVSPPPAPRPMTGGAVMSAVGRFATAGASAIATIVVARLLGPEGSGAYAVAQTLILMLTVATTLGVEHGIVYFVGSGRWGQAAAFMSAQRVALVSGVVGGALGVVARLVVPSAFSGLSVASTVVAAAALPFALSWFYTGYIALATDRYEAYALPTAAQSVLSMFLVAGLAVAAGVPGAVVGITVSNVLIAGAMLVVARRRFHWFGPGASSAPEPPGQLRRAVSFGVKGYASNALQFVNYRLDLFILNAVVTTSAVGQYSIAVGITQVLWLMPQALSDVLFPRVAALSASTAENAEEARAMAETKSLRHTALATLVVTVVLAVALVFLVVPIYGPGFRPAVDLGLILLPGSALLGLVGPLSATVLGRGHPRLMLVVTVVTTPLTIVLYVVLIPWLHASGAALASTISYSMSFVLAAFFYTRVTGHNALWRMIPTRSELADYRRLGPAIAEWARGRTRRAADR